MKSRNLLVNLAVIILTGLVITTISAEELCEAVVRDVWEVVTDNCNGLSLDAACYGNDSLNATFSAGKSTTVFSNPGDQDAINVLQTIRTSPFDKAYEEWGIGDFLIPAEPFGGTGDQKIVVYAAGDVIVENAVPADSELLPMQSFNFTTGGPSECREARNAIFIQSPKELQVDLNVNSTPIRMGSTVMAGTEVDPITGLDIMWFIVLEGKLTLYPDTASAIVIPAGGFTTTLLSDASGKGLNGETIIPQDQLLVIDPATNQPVPGIDDIPFYRQKPVGEFTEPQPLTPDGESYQGWGAYYFATLIPDVLLNYPIYVPLLPDDVVVSNPTPVSQPPAALVSVNNWCTSSGKWDDGRCSNPDPDIQNWFWTAGWYCAALEQGLIEKVPAEYQTCAPQTDATATLPPGVTPSSTPIPPTLTPTITPSVIPSDTPTFTPIPSDTPTFTPIPSDTPTFTPIPSDTPTFTPIPSNTPTLPPTFTPTLTPLTVAVTECTRINSDAYFVTFAPGTAPVGTVKITVRNNFTTQFNIDLPPLSTQVRVGSGRLPLTTATAYDAADRVLEIIGLSGLPPCTPP